MKQSILKITLILVGLAFLLSPAVIAGYKVLSKTSPTNTPTPQVIEVIEEEIEEVFLPASPSATPNTQDATFTPTSRNTSDDDDEKSETEKHEDKEEESPQDDD